MRSQGPLPIMFCEVESVLGGGSSWSGMLGRRPCHRACETQMKRPSLSRGAQGGTEEGLEIATTTLLLIAFVEFLRAETHVNLFPASDRGEGR